MRGVSRRWITERRMMARKGGRQTDWRRTLRSRQEYSAGQISCSGLLTVTTNTKCHNAKEWKVFPIKNDTQMGKLIHSWLGTLEPLWLLMFPLLLHLCHKEPNRCPKLRVCTSEHTKVGRADKGLMLIMTAAAARGNASRRREF